jgi:hypothetical protein
MTTLNRRTLMTLECLAGTATLFRVHDLERTLRFHNEVFCYPIKLTRESTGTPSERLAQENARSHR